MAGRRTAERREGQAEPESQSSAAALLVLLTRALGLDHAALLLDEVAGAAPVVATAHGPGVPGEQPSDATVALPVRAGNRPIGTLRLHLRRGDVLVPRDRALAERVASAIGEVAEARRLAADLADLRQQLARADRLSALGMLSAGVAHEIRNPLVSVRTFIQLLPERLADEEFRTGFRDLALREIERICGLINDLLAFSRPAPAEREPTDLNELVAQITRLVDAEARRRDVTVACRAEPALPLVPVDEAQVKQVLMNVILNAIEACGPHGRVEIATRVEEDGDERWCTVVVADSGPGIASEHVERIFDAFFTTKDAGSGLGLFIARQIVTEHGGYIGTAARSEGGTEFSIHFPLRDRVADVGAV